MLSPLESLVDPGGGVVVPGAEFLGLEPKSNFLLSGLNGIGTVDDVSSDIDAEVTSDGSGLRVERLCGTEHLSASLDSVVTLPDHAADGAGSGVLNETSEERLAGEISVVLLEHLLTGSAQFHGDELESLGLESGNDLTDEASLDTVGLDHDVGSFSLLGLHLVFIIIKNAIDLFKCKIT